MKTDLPGRIRNTVLPKTKVLLPLFEAVVNSIQAIEDGETASPRIDVTVGRDPVLDGLDVIGKIDSFEIADNGIGFDDANLDSFFTSDTRHKAVRGGKGVGRFLWLKAFRCAEVKSCYRDGDALFERTFKFTDNSDEMPVAVPSEAAEPCTVIKLVGFRSPFKELCPQAITVIAHQLVEHCLPFFMNPDCPEITIHDTSGAINLKKYFNENFRRAATRYTFSADGKQFTLTGLRLYNPHGSRHRLLYSANFREVRSDNLDAFMVDIQRSRLHDDNGDSFLYLGFVSGEYLDDNVNSERIGFTFGDKSDDNLLGELSLEDIRVAALECVSVDLRPFLEQINSEKRASIRDYVAQQAPQYRPLAARYMDQLVAKVPPSASPKVLESILHEQMHERQKEIKQEGYKLFESGLAENLTQKEYEDKVADFIERANEFGKSTLAEYVAHRKVILDFLEMSLQSNPATGKHRLEETVHNLIYPMRKTSDEVPYEQQNLWVIDERLSYHRFLASDKRLNKMSDIVESPSASRPDLLIFDRALSFTENESGPLTSMVIVEFKRPDRTDYRKDDPIDQAYRLIREIRSGHFHDHNGREVKLQSSAIPAYAYVICDITAPIEESAINKGFIRTPDNQGFYFYNPGMSAYVEIIPYDKLVNDAKKRNKILFDKLNLAVPPFWKDRATTAQD